MPQMTKKEMLQRAKQRMDCLAKGKPVPPVGQVKRKPEPPVSVTIRSKPTGSVPADMQALPESVIREQAFAQARYDVVQASGNATRPLGRKTFTVLPEFKPAQRAGHDELGFCQVRRDNKQLSQAQDKVWVQAYREAVAYYREALKPEPSRKSSVYREKNCARDRSPLGRDQHVSSVDLSSIDPRNKPEQGRELSQFAPYVQQAERIDLSPKPSAVVPRQASEIAGAERTAFNHATGTNRRVD